MDWIVIMLGESTYIILDLAFTHQPKKIKIKKLKEFSPLSKVGSGKNKYL